MTQYDFNSERHHDEVINRPNSLPLFAPQPKFDACEFCDLGGIQEQWRRYPTGHEYPGGKRIPRGPAPIYYDCRVAMWRGGVHLDGVLYASVERWTGEYDHIGSTRVQRTRMALVPVMRVDGPCTMVKWGGWVPPAGWPDWHLYPAQRPEGLTPARWA